MHSTREKLISLMHEEKEGKEECTELNTLLDEMGTDVKTAIIHASRVKGPTGVLYLNLASFAIFRSKPKFFDIIVNHESSLITGENKIGPLSSNFTIVGQTTPPLLAAIHTHSFPMVETVLKNPHFIKYLEHKPVQCKAEINRAFEYASILYGQHKSGEESQITRKLKSYDSHHSKL